VRNVEWRRGELESLPLEDATADLALLSQALHHAAEPGRALAEAARVLVPGGRLLVLDLRRHEQAWVHERLGDRWLGFEDDQLHGLLEAAGFSDVRVRVGAKLTGDPFTVLVAAGTKQPRRTRPSRRAERAARG
jgi:ArsR family transcriptional regulator